jgi:hypothetical protein
LTKEPKTYNGEKIDSSTNVAGKKRISVQVSARRLIRPETLKIVQERAENTLELICIDNDFLNRTQIAHQLRERIDK